MIEHGASGFPQAQPVDQSGMGATAQPVRQEGGTLRSLFRLCGKATERPNRAEIRQGAA